MKSSAKTLNISHDVMRVAARVARMSTSEDIPLHFIQEKEDGNDTTEQLEHGDTTDNKYDTMPSVRLSRSSTSGYKPMEDGHDHSDNLTGLCVSECWNLYDWTVLSHRGQLLLSSA